MLPQKTFLDFLVQRVRSRADLVGSFTTHKTLTGIGRERSLLDLLREMLPRRFEALTGVIARFDSAKSARKGARLGTGRPRS